MKRKGVRLSRDKFVSDGYLFDKIRCKSRKGLLCQRLHLCFAYFADLSIIGVETVTLFLHIGELGVYHTAQTVCNRGQDHFSVKCLDSCGERRFAVRFPIAVFLIRRKMLRDGLG